MKQDTEHKLDRLLSGGPGPGLQEKEAILNTLLEQPSAALPWWRSKPAWLAFACATTAAVIFGYALLRLDDTADPEYLASRGQAGQPNVAMRIACGEKMVTVTSQTTTVAPLQCHTGSPLVLAVLPATNSPKSNETKPDESRYFASAALGPEQTLLWLFPTEQEEYLSLANSPISRAIDLDNSLPAGHYRLFGFVAERPLKRSDLRPLLENISASTTGAELASLDLISACLVGEFALAAP